MKVERWVPISGYEGRYEISDFGRVRSLPSSRTKGTILVFGKHRLGYRFVFLSPGHDRDRKNYYVHRLVFSNFMGSIPDGLEINHKNGDKADNTLDNLETCTRSGNMKHAAETMGRNRGEQSGRAKITTDQAIQIKALAGSMRVRDIAAKFDIAACTVSNIIAGRRWFYV